MEKYTVIYKVRLGDELVICPAYIKTDDLRETLDLNFSNVIMVFEDWVNTIDLTPDEENE